jgi:uncharacterized protein (TIGR03437 family)
MLDGPADVAVDQAGDLFIADDYNNKIRKVSPDGIITTVANSFSPGLGDIEGVAADAGELHLDGTTSVAADNRGNFYFQAGWYIYRVNPAGVITLLVGGGLKGYQEGFDGDGGPSVAAHLVRDSFPGGNAAMGMTLDAAGNLYFADTGNDRIRKVTNPHAAAQLAITTPDSYTLYPPTGGDEFDLSLYGTNTQSVNILNVGVGAMDWTATTSTLSGGDWLALSSGSGNAPSTIIVSAETGGLAPGFYIGTVTLTSPASNSPRYVEAYMTEPIPFLSQNATTGTLVVTEPPGVGWSASSDSSWLTFPSGSSGVGNGTLNYSVAANVGGSPPYRTANITIGYQRMVVNQGVGLVSQTITFGPLSNVMLGTTPFAISATSSSGLPLTFASTATVVCAVSGNMVTILGSGTCTITASQAGNANYAPATPVALSFNVGAGPIGTPPLLQPGGVVTVGSSINIIQPGSWVAINGSNLATSTVLWNGDFPVSLAGTSVSINGKAAYLAYVSPGEIILQAPDDTTTGPVSVVVTTPNGSSASTVLLAPASPSFLRLDSAHVSGIIVRTDGSYDIIGPTGTSLGYQTIAAKVGDTVELYGVGFGPTKPNVSAGQPFSGAAATASQVYLMINNISVIPSFAGLSSAGLYQIKVTIPPGLGIGDVPLLATVGGVQTPTGLVISLQ